MGLSAGTAVVLYALEALPESYQVDGAFLLSASVSANYDLTKALRRVKNRMYVFTSAKDGVLRNFVPMVGTADRERGSATTAGLRGFRIPANASEDTQVLYAKVVHVHWSHEMQKVGHRGWTTSCTASWPLSDWFQSENPPGSVRSSMAMSIPVAT